MNLLNALVALPGTVLRTAVRRARQGPQRPSWTFTFELLMAWMRGLPRSRDAETVRARRAFMEKVAPAGPAVKQVAVAEVDAGGVPAVWVTPKAGASDTVVLYFHGGGYVMGSTRSYKGSLAQLAVDSGARVLGVDYRLAPEHPYPAALEDARAAWRWLRSTGVEASRVVVAGDSAGGGLTLALLLALVEAGEALPAGAVLLSPWVDLTCAAPSHEELAAHDFLDVEELRFWGRCYAGKLEPGDARLSPLKASLRGLPPLAIQVGDAELFRDPVREFAEKARAEGVAVTLDECAHLPHVATAFGDFFPPAREAAVRVGEAVRRLAAGAGRTQAPANAAG